MRVGSDFSGVGAFDQAMIRLGVDYTTVYACDMDKYARQTYIANYGEPDYYPENVYDREIPKEPLDIYMTSPPCQAFSIAGKKKGETDKRGVLFYNSHEFIIKNRPRYFIFENVKGLLSDDNGKTFQRWIDLLAKSVNGNPMIFPHDDSANYHVYHMVLNTKDYGVPQNRERIFIVGIRDDKDNSFRFPKTQHLTKRLKDVLEDGVDEKFYLSKKMLKGFVNGKSEFSERFKIRNIFKYASCIDTKEGGRRTNNFILEKEWIGDYRNDEGLRIRKDGDRMHNIKTHIIPQKVKVRKHDVNIKALQKCLKKHKNMSLKKISEKLKIKKTTVEHWFRIDKCFSIPDADIWMPLKNLLNIKTAVFDAPVMEFIEKDGEFDQANRVYDVKGLAPTITSTSTDERIIDTTCNQSVVDSVHANYRHHFVGFKGFEDLSPTIKSSQGSGNQIIINNIRRLTPRECFRLQDFPDTFKMPCSDSQMYKQAGNSITVGVLYNILKNLL